MLRSGRIKTHFSTVKIDTTDLVAEAKTDITLTVTSGTGITLTPTAASDSFSVALTVDGNEKASHSHVLSAGTTDGFMSSTQASNLATIPMFPIPQSDYNFGK